MKKVRRILLLVILAVLLAYVTNITAIPDSIVLFQGEELNLGTIFGITMQAKQGSYQTIQASSNIGEDSSKDLSQQTGKVNVSLKLGEIPVKDVTVNVIPKTMVVPVGDTVGLKLYTSGVLVVGMSEIEGQDSNKYKPYDGTDIKEGDMIVEINNKTVACTADLMKQVNSSGGKDIKVKYVRSGDVHETSITPIKTGNNEYKLGLWVRDAAAGVGTVTFYDPESGMYAALGHGILDIDTEQLINIAKGDLVTSNIISIIKGEKGKPGEIKGTIENGQTVGSVYKNTSLGIYGKLTNPSVLGVDKSKQVEVLSRNEIKKGKASILCSLENNKQEEYEVEIEKVFTNNNEDNKSMIIKVKDERLLDKTGGIIQGMSGSPILQDGKFVGAVTHVLVNDPTMGYGVFADMMLKQMREVE